MTLNEKTLKNGYCIPEATFRVLALTFSQMGKYGTSREVLSALALHVRYGFPLEDAQRDELQARGLVTNEVKNVCGVALCGMHKDVENMVLCHVSDSGVFVG